MAHQRALPALLLSTVFVLASTGCEQPRDQATPPDAGVSTTAPPRPAPTVAASPTPPPAPAAPAPPKAEPPAAPADVAKAPADAKKTPSGLAWKRLAAGGGKEHPGPDDEVEVHYTGWTTDGRMFDSSIPRGAPSKFRLSGVIKGWTEGLQLLVVGDKARLWIPAALAYGEQPRPGAPKGDLVFDVELVGIHPAPKPPPVPPDVKAAPPDAKKTASGLAYKVLSKGKGTRTPKATDRVTVHYSGWTPDGKMFDSSVTRNEPTTFPLSGVIKGWTEGVQLMHEGDKARFWIPSDLAYGDKPKRPGAPAGPLVFDIELLAIQ